MPSFRNETETDIDRKQLGLGRDRPFADRGVKHFVPMPSNTFDSGLSVCEVWCHNVFPVKSQQDFNETAGAVYSLRHLDFQSVRQRKCAAIEKLMMQAAK